jgi:hypothetical protein
MKINLVIKRRNVFKMKMRITGFRETNNIILNRMARARVAMVFKGMIIKIWIINPL